MAIPKLRRELDIFPIEYNNKPYFCVRDIEGYQEETLLVTPEVLVIASLFDGRNDKEVVKTFWQKNFPTQILTDENIEQVIRLLDEKLLLESPHFEEEKNKIIENFKASPNRKPFLAGKSYPNEKATLEKYIENFFIQDNGPGPINKEDGIIKHIKGFISPHIDFARGGHCYAYCYKEYAESIQTTKALILGVAHAGPPYPYILLDKNFETPLGTVNFDEQFKKYISPSLYKNLTHFQFTHKTEHSIEFQTIWLKFVNPNIKIVPVLCSILPNEAVQAEADEFINACKKYIEDNNGDVVVVSGADLSHIGPRFGDNVEINNEIIKWMEKEDIQSLKYAEEIDAEGFLQFTLKQNDVRKVCGLTSIYTTLQIIKEYAQKGTLLKYSYAEDPAGGVVSFASLIFS
jgi:MEMO1 family protein